MFGVESQHTISIVDRAAISPALTCHPVQNRAGECPESHAAQIRQSNASKTEDEKTNMGLIVKKAVTDCRHAQGNNAPFGRHHN